MLDPVLKFDQFAEQQFLEIGAAIDGLPFGLFNHLIQHSVNPHDPTGPYNYFNPWWHPFYRRGDLHTMQSVTKTVTSVVIGVARARNEFPDLDTHILGFFDARSPDR